MKKYRKLFVLLPILLGLSITSCGDPNPSTTSSQGTQTSETTDETTISDETTSDTTLDSTSDTTSETTSETTSDTTSDSSTTSDDTTSIVVNEYSISVVPSDDIEVSVESKAQEGQVITVSLTYDSNDITILKVLANSVECGKRSQNEYYFEMPNQNVIISVQYRNNNEYHKISMPVATSQAITLTDIDINQTFKEGSTIKTRVSVTPGFNFHGKLKATVGLSGFNPYDLEISTEVIDNETYYSFVMPDDDVTITAETTRANFKVSYSEDDSNLISSIRQHKVGADYDVNVNDDFIEFGATVTVSLKNTDTLKAESLTIPQLKTTFDDLSNIEFTMPAMNIAFEVNTTDYLRDLIAVNSEHLTLSFYTTEDNITYTPVTSAVYDEYVYVKVDGISDTINILSLEATYSSYESINLLENEYKYDDTYYRFKMPLEDDEGVTITVVEKDLSKFKDAPFLGSYLGRNIYTGSSSGVAAQQGDSYSPTIDGSGIFTFKNDIVLDEYDPETKIMTGHDADDASDIYQIMYSEKILFSSYGLSISSDIGSDNLFAIKKENASDDNASYTVVYELINNRSATVVQYLKDGEAYAGAFIDIANDKVYLNVRFDLLNETTSITDKMAEYDIINLDTNEKIVSVSSTGTGGNNNRIFLDGLQGTYTGDKGDLVLNGGGSATLDGTTYTYSVGESNTIVLISGATTITISLDLDSYTYTVISEQGPENEYHGYLYSGYLTDNFGDSLPFSIKFVTGSTCKLTVGTSYITYIPNSQWPTDAVETYSIDEASGVITVNTYDQDGDPITLTLTPNQDKTILTVNEDISSIYQSAGCTLTRQ